MPKTKSTPAPEVTDFTSLVEKALEGADTLTIKQAVAISGLSEVYIRKALKAGKLVATKVPVCEGSKNLRNEITVASFQEWRKSAGAHSKREDGRGKFVIYMTADEEAALKAFVDNGFTGIYQRANLKPVEATE